MTSDELKNEIITRLRFMNQEERAECISELYGMDIIDRKRARELMGIDELVFQKRVIFDTGYPALEERFESLSDDFLSRKILEEHKEYGG